MSTFARVTLPLAGVNFINQASRAVVATVSPLLAAEFALSASELGFLAAIFFAAYGLAQLPVGMALDRWGARSVQIGMSLLAAVGFLISGLSADAVWLGVGRVITGVGVSAGLMGMLKANNQWYPKERVAAVTGAGIFVGAMGGVCATLPVQWMLPEIGWRGCFLVMAVVAVGIALWIWLAAPGAPPRPGAPWRGVREELGHFARIFVSPPFLYFTPAVIMLSTLNFTYQGLWAGPWLRDVGGLDDTPRATVLLVMAAGIMFGAVFTGHLTSAVQKRGLKAMIVPWTALGLSTIVQGLLALHVLQHPFAIAVLWFLLACCGSAGTAGYSAIGVHFGPELAGRVATAINGSMLLLTFCTQNAIGWILDLWPRTATGGWDPAGYGWAFGLTLALQTIAIVWMILGPRLGRRPITA